MQAFADSHAPFDTIGAVPGASSLPRRSHLFGWQEKLALTPAHLVARGGKDAEMGTKGLMLQLFRT